eukprot:11929195-Ditylum_brightwellii.AAC.1
MIWSLPVFWNGSIVQSTSPFELIYALLQHVGLVEDENGTGGGGMSLDDIIDDQLPISSSFNNNSTTGRKEENVYEVADSVGIRY